MLSHLLAPRWSAARKSEPTDPDVVRLDLPGVAPEDLDIRRRGRTIMIRAERKNPARRFEAAYLLPPDVERVAARLEQGVLALTLVRSPGSEEERIEVDAA